MSSSFYVADSLAPVAAGVSLNIGGIYKGGRIVSGLYRVSDGESNKDVELGKTEKNAGLSWHFELAGGT